MADTQNQPEQDPSKLSVPRPELGALEHTAEGLPYYQAPATPGSAVPPDMQGVVPIDLGEIYRQHSERQESDALSHHFMQRMETQAYANLPESKRVDATMGKGGAGVTPTTGHGILGSVIEEDHSNIARIVLGRFSGVSLPFYGPSDTLLRPGTAGGDLMVDQQRKRGQLNAPPGAIDALHTYPQMRDHFDAKYGAGSAAMVLGGAP